MTTAEDIHRTLATYDEVAMRTVFEANCDDPSMWPVFCAGHWLSLELEKHGATEQQRKDASFALGQRLCMNPPDRWYDIAAATYDRWVANSMIRCSVASPRESSPVSRPSQRTAIRSQSARSSGNSLDVTMIPSPWRQSCSMSV